MDEMADKKPRTKKEMLEYLQEHFRYYTQNSWNLSTSYAHNVKFRSLKLTSEERDKAYDLLGCNEVWEDIRILMGDFGERHDWEWQMVFNGRSDGYIVLIKGGYNEYYIAEPDMKPGESKYSDKIGRWIYYKEAKKNGWIGKKYKQIYIQSGLDFDGHTDLKDLDCSELKWRVDIVWDFDKTVEKIFELFRHYCRNAEVKEETIMIPKKIKTAVFAEKEA